LFPFFLSFGQFCFRVFHNRLRREHLGETGPTIDSIEIGEFATYEERREWLKKKAPAFVQ
jgi:hypothetical protein